MKTNEKAKKALSLTQEIYFQLREHALALALACTLDKKQACAKSCETFVRAGKRALSNPQRKTDVLGYLFRHAKQGGIYDARQFDFLPADFAKLNKLSRAAWALTRSEGMAADEAMKVLGASQSAFSQAIAQADQLLNTGHARNYNLLVRKMQDKREVWSDVGFALEQYYRLGHQVRMAVASILLTILLVFAVREGSLWIKILRFPGTLDKAVISQTYDDPACYKKQPLVPGIDKPGISGHLAAQLENIKDDEMVRVALRFYDAELMADIRQNGDNLLDIYLDLYQTGMDRGHIHTLIANAIQRYYSNYKRPFQVKGRTENFVSHYDSLHTCALDLASGSNFSKTVAAHPEIFSSRDNFDAYLTGSRFRQDLPQVTDLLTYEAIIQSHMASGKPPSATVQEKYENLLYAFTNPAGLGGKLSPDTFSYVKEETDPFFADRELLGKELYTQTVKLLKQLLPQAQVTSDILEGSESSLFSATLSKQQILSHAGDDERFFFLGIAPPYAAAYPDGLEHGLAAAIHLDRGKVYDVFLIDEEYVLYSVNYAAPLTLPQGFIDQLRSRVASKYTMFEQKISFTYQMRFAHPQPMAGWRILRSVYLNENLRYALKDYKYFSKMDKY